MDCDIMVVKIGKRTAKAIEVQEVLTKFGCSIKTRLGLHEAGNVCAEEGILILQLAGDKQEMLALEAALNKMDGIKAQIVML